MGLDLPFDPGESIQASRLAWAIERYAAGELSAEQIEETHEFDPGYGVSSQLRRFRLFRRPVDEVLSYEPDSVYPRAVVRSGEDTAVVAVRVSDSEEHRILAMSLMKRPAPGVTTRRANETDAGALRDLARRCAVETEGVSTYYDRGEDYFSQQRLMEHHVTSVAEHDGQVVGVLSDAIRRIRVAGTVYRATYRFHLRVDPAARGLGILPALNAANSPLVFAGRPLPLTSSFVAAENAQMLAAIGPVQEGSHWKTNVERLTLPCRATGGPPVGRAAMPSDAERVAALLTASHGDEELALDFDAASVEQRMTRSPDDYSWRNVIVAERAVLGVWDAGLRIIRAAASGTTETRTATALDWGYEVGAEAEMEALVRAACGVLADAGVDDLVIFSSPPSRGHDLLASLARNVEPFRVNGGAIQPRTAESNGVYVDPIYF